LFCTQGIMKVDIRKRFKEVKWTTEHTLSQEQLKQLIRDKMERARLGHRAVVKREIAQG